MKKTLTVLCVVFSIQLCAQIPRTVLVEHFTNTLCSVCASRNPDFYTNLNNQTNVLHIAYHPSSPYSACILNKHNKAENDGRANRYGVYGATPRLVIQGKVIAPGVNYGAQTMFDPFLNKNSPFEISTRIQDAPDSIHISISIKTLATQPFDSMFLYAALVEETLNYNAPNGENTHHDVFRKTIFNPSGISIPLPGVNDSLLVLQSIAKHPDWNLSEMYVISSLFVADSVMQSARSSKLHVTTGIRNVNSNLFSLSPNPASNRLRIQLKHQNPSTVSIYHINGAEVLTTTINGSEELDIRSLNPGMYFIHVTTSQGNEYRKLIIER